MDEFELRKECNVLLAELTEAIGKKNIVKLGIDVQLPDRFKGSATSFLNLIKKLADFIDSVLVNGIIHIEINYHSPPNTAVTLLVRLAGMGDHRITATDKVLIEDIKKNSGVILKDRISPQEISFEFTYALDTTGVHAPIRKLALEGRRILLAEDNEINAMVFASFLEEWGSSTTVAINGAEAVSLAHDKEFDAILMDIFMPVLNGNQATRKIREFNPIIPIIALTASTRDEDIREAIDAGANAYLLKPVSSANLLQVLVKHLA